MKKVIYSKCATERKKEYRIITSIVEDEGCKSVYKKPLNKFAQRHVEKMYEVYSNNLMEHNKLYLAPCKKGENDSVIFEYIEGYTLLEKLEELSDRKEWDEFLALIKEYLTIIYDISNKQKFESSELFEAFFGKTNGLEEYEAAEFLNIDLLPENIIIKDDKYFVIDYEWIMPFLVPIKYVMFRVLFFSPVFGRIPQDIRKEILSIADITEEEWQMFLEMEIRFQGHVSDSSLDELYKKMPQNVFCTDNQMIGMRSMDHIIAKDESNAELYHLLSANKSGVFTFKIKKDGWIKVILTNSPSIIKIKEVKVNDVLIDDFKTNCMLQIVDDYYFAKEAILELNVKADAEIMIDYIIMSNPDNELVALANALKTNHELEIKNIELDKWNNAYQEKIRSLETDILSLGDERTELNKKICSIQDENDILRRELHQIKSARGWSLYTKMNKLN